MLIHGSCHCGNLSFKLHWEPDPAAIPARACGCTFCVKHGAVWTSYPSARLAVTVQERSLVSRYWLGTATAIFHICTRCGAVPVVSSDIDNRLYAAVSVNAFNNVPETLLERSAANFEGESVEARLGRRKLRWIADVQGLDSGADQGVSQADVPGIETAGTGKTGAGINAWTATKLAAVHPVLASRDVTASIQFYTALGFRETFRDSPSAPRYAAVSRDGVELHLQWHDAEEWAHPGDRPVYRFCVVNVDGLFQELTQGDSSLDRTDVMDTAWGTREFHVRDPDGNGLQFYQLA